MKHYSKTSYQFYRQLTKIQVKFLVKIGNAWFIFKKWQVISIILKLFQYKFRNCLEFTDKMDLTIQIKTLNSVKHLKAISLRFGDRYFTFLTILKCEAQASHLLCNQRKSNFILPLVFGICCHSQLLSYDLSKISAKLAMSLKYNINFGKFHHLHRFTDEAKIIWKSFEFLFFEFLLQTINHQTVFKNALE